MRVNINLEVVCHKCDSVLKISNLSLSDEDTILNIEPCDCQKSDEKQPPNLRCGNCGWISQPVMAGNNDQPLIDVATCQCQVDIRSQLISEIKSLNEQLRVRNDQYDQLSLKRTDLRSRNSRHQDKIAELRSKIKELKHDYEICDEAASGMRQQAIEYRAKIRRRNDEIGLLNEQIKMLKMSRSQLPQCFDDFETLRCKMKKILRLNDVRRHIAEYVLSEMKKIREKS